MVYNENEVFTIPARRCKRCGGLLTSSQGIRDGYGPCCLRKVRREQADREEEAQNQYSFFSDGLRPAEDPGQNRRTAAMLTLPIKRQWYDMILCGQKREEYREDNPYYRSRFEKLFDLSPEALADPVRQKASVLRLRNGYNAAADTMEITAVLQHGEGRPEWGAEPGKPCFILRILSVKSV